MTITLRNTKGSELTFTELDGNFTDLDTRVDMLPDSAQVLGLIDSAYVGARQGATGLTLSFKDRDSNEFSLAITQAASITTGAPIGFGNSIQVLLEDSSEFTITL